eukprot:COSAG02_NODE_29756_length_563_cov_1.790948_1_plen_134_part_10
MEGSSQGGYNGCKYLCIPVYYKALFKSSCLGGENLRIDHLLVTDPSPPNRAVGRIPQWGDAYLSLVIDIGHKALCPVSRYVDRAYLWAPARGTGHTCRTRGAVSWEREIRVEDGGEATARSLVRLGAPPRLSGG